MKNRIMENKYQEIMDSLLSIILPKINMNKPNEKFSIHNGNFVLRFNNKNHSVSGNIDFKWLPSPQVKFKGSSQDKMNWDELFSSPEVQVIIDNSVLGSGLITAFSQSENISVSGIIKPKVISGDRSINCSFVHFEVGNLRNFCGESVKQKHTILNNRLVFENEKCKITIDKNPDYTKKLELLKDEGGYLLNYSGKLELNNKNGLSFKESSEILECFALFLSFLNGRRCSALFRQGIFDDRTVWCDYTGYLTDQYKSVTTWPQKHETAGLDCLWKEFSQKWLDENDRDCLNTVIHWYVEANGNSGFVEGAITMVQNALELLYNWLIVEKLKIIKGDDAKNLSAANKIRQLLSQISFNSAIPATLDETTRFINGHRNDYQDVDGPEIFVTIRNAIVHSNVEKRKKLSSIPNRVRYEALQLGLLYVELSLLYILNFNGKYFNRCSGEKWAGNGEEKVPWI